jgi:hypothetical protein
LAQESDRMATLIADAQSDEAVAEWARDEGKLILPGEVLVQPLAPTAASATPETPVYPAGAVPNWRFWLEWLWGND